MLDMKWTIKYFSKSNMSTAELRKARKDASMGQGVISIGKTRFVMHWTAAVALQKNLLLMRNLIIDGTAKPKVCPLVLDLYRVYSWNKEQIGS
jgi:hypothetical protein